MKKLLEGVSKEEVVQALRAFGQVDVRADPMSSLPLEMALAECVLARQAAEAKPQPAPPSPVERREAPPMRPPAPAPIRDNRAPARGPARRTDAPVASSEPVAAETPDDLPASGPSSLCLPKSPPCRRSGRTSTQLARKINFKAGALLNSGCAIKSVDDGTIRSASATAR